MTVDDSTDDAALRRIIENTPVLSRTREQALAFDCLTMRERVNPLKDALPDEDRFTQLLKASTTAIYEDAAVGDEVTEILRAVGFAFGIFRPKT